MTETWWLPPAPGVGERWGTVLENVHGRENCQGTCALHNPSDHWARAMPLTWHGLLLRVCPHGLLHQDPDAAEWGRRAGSPRYPPEVPARGAGGPWSCAEDACACPCDCRWRAPAGAGPAVPPF